MGMWCASDSAKIDVQVDSVEYLSGCEFQIATRSVLKLNWKNGDPRNPANIDKHNN